jgi:hypothetical protein
MKVISHGEQRLSAQSAKGRAGVRLGVTAFASQLAALTGSYVVLYQWVLVPQLDTMYEIGPGWLVLLSLPTLATTVRLSRSGCGLRSLVILALGSGVGVTALLAVCCAVGSPGFRKASAVDVPWIPFLLLSSAAFLLVIAMSTAAKRSLRRSTGA